MNFTDSNKGSTIMRATEHLVFEPIFLSYTTPKAVSPGLGLGAQANIRSTM